MGASEKRGEPIIDVAEIPTPPPSLAAVPPIDALSPPPNPIDKEGNANVRF